MSQASSAAVLALDTGSPTVSVAVARDGQALAERAVEIGRSSQKLIGMVDGALADAGVRSRDLAGIVALAGPGSFTGLRVGLATALGLHQALGVPATAVPTLEALAACLADEPGPVDEEAWPRVVAVVDVLRDEWAYQELTVDGGPPRPRTKAERLATAAVVERLAAGEPARVVGFGLDVLRDALADLVAGGQVTLHEPASLAASTARAATLHPPAWNPQTLTNPLYFRPPAVTLPKPRS
jgi:tRNA threonylcarbamoyl adenosine modification protein YeaZ